MAAITAVGWISLNLYSRANIDSEADEALFLAAKSSNVSRFYANAAPLGSDVYIPTEIKSYSGAEVKKDGFAGDFLCPAMVMVDAKIYEGALTANEVKTAYDNAAASVK